MISYILLLALPLSTSAWSAAPQTRRDAFGQAVSAAIGVASASSVVLPSIAMPTEETPRVTTRMGGNLEPYQERGIRIMAPSGKRFSFYDANLPLANCFFRF